MESTAANPNDQVSLFPFQHPSFADPITADHDRQLLGDSAQSRTADRRNARQVERNTLIATAKRAWDERRQPYTRAYTDLTDPRFPRQTKDGNAAIHHRRRVLLRRSHQKIDGVWHDKRGRRCIRRDQVWDKLVRVAHRFHRQGRSLGRQPPSWESYEDYIRRKYCGLSQLDICNAWNLIRDLQVFMISCYP